MRSLASVLLLAGLCGLLLCLPVCTQQAQASDTCVLTTTSSSAALPGDYPLTNLRISLRVKYSKPGTVLDTVGINAAPAGSFALAIGADGKPVFLLYEPGKESSVRASNGWHVIPSDTAIPTDTDANIDIDVLEKKIVLSVNGKVEKEVDVEVKLSGKTVYIGDNPEDDTWGDSYNIHPAMIGEVQALYFGDVSKAPARSEEKGQVVELTSSSSSAKLPEGYPVTNLRMSLTVKYSKSGVVLDTVGINEAPEGSFTLNINSAGKPVFAVFSPDTESAVKLDNGWHVISADAAIPPDTEGKVDVDVREKGIAISVNGKLEKKVDLAVKLSGKTVYVGDTPEDDSWGDSYNIHPAMVGTVRVRFFGEIPKGEPAAETPAPPTAATPTPPAAETPPPPPPPPPATGGDAKPEAPPAEAGAKLPEPPPTDAPIEGVKEIAKALESGVAETAAGAFAPFAQESFRAVFAEHPEAMKRIAALLAAAKPKFAEGVYAEYEITDGGKTFTIMMEKIGDRWFVTDL